MSSAYLSRVDVVLAIWVEVMITDEELESLPDDPELAFVQYERNVRSKVVVAIRDAEESAEESDPFKLEYISHILAAVKGLGVKILIGWELPKTDNISSYFDSFVAAVDHETVQLRIKHTRRQKRYSVSLNPSTKEKIRHYLEQIKQQVDRLEVTQKKKEALYSKILALEEEVNRDRTRFDAVMALVLEAADTGGKSAQKLEPMRKWIDSITGMVGKAKEEEDESIPALPAPPKQRQIEPPREKT